MDDLAGKYEAWKRFCARPYKRYAKPEYKREINRKSATRLNKEDPLTSRVSDLIPVEIRRKLNKIGL